MTDSTWAERIATIQQQADINTLSELQAQINELNARLASLESTVVPTPDTDPA